MLEWKRDMQLQGQAVKKDIQEFGCNYLYEKSWKLSCVCLLRMKNVFLICAQIMWKNGQTTLQEANAWGLRRELIWLLNLGFTRVTIELVYIWVSLDIWCWSLIWFNGFWLQNIEVILLYFLVILKTSNYQLWDKGSLWGMSRAGP